MQKLSIHYFKQTRMRKLMIATSALFLGAILFTSCKSHQTCPAYGSIDTEATEKLPA